MLFMLSAKFTDQGVRGLKDAPKRAQASRELAKKMGAEIKQVYMTTGDSDLVFLVETANGDNMLKFAMALGMQGNLHTKTARAWPMEDFMKLVAELP
ncbi:MAG TPA: GYD domain-containing protein [Pseudolabrys sp.]|nr:GYD domain-containing protein [Pseudolabrys sp.]